MRNKVVIIGGVAGGASCAARLRRLDEEREIVLLERGNYISYANCGLPYHVGDVIKSRDALLLQSPEAMRSKFKIDAEIEKAWEEIVRLPWYMQGDGSFILHHDAIPESQKRLIRMFDYHREDEMEKITIISEGRYQDGAFLVKPSDTAGTLYQRLLAHLRHQPKLAGPLSTATICRV